MLDGTPGANGERQARRSPPSCWSSTSCGCGCGWIPSASRRRSTRRTSLRRQFAETRQRYQKADFKVRDADIDFEVARSYLNAGQVDRAEPLFLRARSEGEPTAEVTIELANLALKRGDPRRAIADPARGASTPCAPTPPRTRSRRPSAPSRAAPASTACSATPRDIAGERDGRERRLARRAHRLGAPDDRAPRRKSFTASAEAEFEVGTAALPAGPSRRGRCRRSTRRWSRTATATSRTSTWSRSSSRTARPTPPCRIYRRAHGAPAGLGLRVRERLHVAVDLDLTRRTGKTPTPTPRPTCARWTSATGDLARTGARPGTGSWPASSRQDDLRADPAAADTAAKRAEIYFYEAMRRLGDGKSDDAHALWKRSIDTQMFSFFEFDMASRYLRVGAPSAPPGDAHHDRNDLRRRRQSRAAQQRIFRREARLSRAVLTFGTGRCRGKGKPLPRSERSERWRCRPDLNRANKGLAEPSPYHLATAPR